MHPMNTDPAQSSAPARSSNIGRRVGGIVGRVVSLAVIGGAAVGGWIAVETFALPQLDASAAPAVRATNPWPVEYPEPDAAAFASFTMTYELDGQVTHTMTHDAATLRTRMTFYDDAGALDHLTEAAGNEFWRSSPSEPEWRLADVAETNRDRVLGLRRVRPMNVNEIIPPLAYPFVEITAEESAGDYDRYRITLDTDAFQARLPHEFHDWALRVVSGSGVTTEWALEVRPDGYVARWEGRSASTETWVEPTATPVFESSLAPRTPLADLDPADDVSAERVDDD
ncbi:hypothetical protein YM304_27720 [Ilumatobacter coccineus YM16-304]|uniref:Uncharacterized protein n=2 Tax=Ilumatobacter coccineus TaxID=467094 RepID=A0A6C7EGJ1_ILUCY|nr:hypothetical protein YM304_27720 [Ilumatobacter coccineus YM16-304]